MPMGVHCIKSVVCRHKSTKCLIILRKFLRVFRLFLFYSPSNWPLNFHMVRGVAFLLNRGKVMKHKLTIGVSNVSPKSKVVTHKKVSPKAKVKDVIGDASKVAIIVPSDSVKSIMILKSEN